MPSKPASAWQRLRRARWGRAALIATVTVCVGYAPIAMTELWPYASPGAPAIGRRLLADAVSPQYVAQALATRLTPYQRSLIPLIVHSVLGGMLMLLGPLQLLTALRRRRRLHRALGVVFAAAVYACMAAAAVYLARTPPAQAFSGAAFWVALAAILVGTVLSVTFGILAAVARMPDVHQRWMLLCFGFLMSAPLLRLEWGALPMLYPGLPMASINEIAIMHLGSVCAFGGLLAARTIDRRPTVRGVEGTWVPTSALVAVHVAGAAALVWISRAYLGWGVDGTRRLTWYLIPFAVTWAIMTYGQVRAGRTGRTWAREEWRVQQAFLCLAPLLSLVVAAAVQRSVAVDAETAMTAGVSVGCGTTAVFATVVVSLRRYHARETVRRLGQAAGSRAGVVAAPVELSEAGQA
ncbi:DUF2306 domain-containing protein [Actinospica durhamensis]|uniref:DUF2306 domain-containing protein n=1 Tax=Actinospica durhamensis TaxID=1508375 RepID=A0A941ITI3_9ACTN|nr:DUF2306 domain-containing protein [Actinospica durhamensis]MBR7837657.1 DUF2306 domain-containing protein [Actinospica durhamensis]